MPDSGNSASAEVQDMIDDTPEQVEKIRLLEKDREWREKMVGQTIEGNHLTMKTATPEDYGIDIKNITSESQLDIAKALLEQPPTEANKLQIWENSRARINAEELDRQRTVNAIDARNLADAEIERLHKQSQVSDQDKQEMQKHEKDTEEKQSNIARDNKTVQDATFESEKRKGSSDDNAAKAAAQEAEKVDKQRERDAKGLEEQRAEKAEAVQDAKDRNESRTIETGSNARTKPTNVKK